MVRSRGDSGAATGADSALLRDILSSVFKQMIRERRGPGPGPGPDQCHDITVYPALALAGGACEGYGLLIDISDPVNPQRIDAAADSNFAYWHRDVMVQGWYQGGVSVFDWTDPDRPLEIAFFDRGASSYVGRG